MAKRPKLHLIDGSGYIFRAYYAIRPLTARDGTPTQAVVGFAKMLHKLLRKENPSHIAIAFDTNEPNFRHQIYDQYKANRSEPPADLLPQFPLIFELVRLMGLFAVSKVGFEADDVLATQAREAIALGYDVVLVTGDKDLMQLVGDHLTIFDPMKDQFFARDDVIARFQVPPERIIDLLALAGDSSDNIPGVPKVGPISAAKLIAEFGDLDGIVAGVAAKAKRKAYEQHVADNVALARLSKRLVALDEHVPVPFSIPALAYAGPDRDALAAFFSRIDADSLLRDYALPAVPPAAQPQAPGAAAPAGDQYGPLGPAAPAQADGHGTGSAAASKASSGTHAAPKAQRGKSAGAEGGMPTSHPSLTALLGTSSPTRPIDRASYRTILVHDDLLEVAQAIGKAKLVSVDTETTSLNPMVAELIGISCAWPDGTPVYIPLGHHYLGAPKQLGVKSALKVLGPLLEDPAIAKVGQNLKYDALVFGQHGVALTGIAHDAMLAAYVLDPSRMAYGLDALALDILGHQTIAYDAVTGRGKNKRPFFEVPIEEATAYAGEDADVALRLCQLLVAKIYETGRDGLYRDLEMPLVPVLAAMERAGIAIDEAHLGRLNKEFARRLRDIEQDAAKQIGRTINLNSPKQLAQLFFEELKLTPGRKTKSGYSTDQSTLEALAHEHALPATILQHRLLSKLQGTYVEALPRIANPKTHRVHTSFQQTGTATGRLSSTDPNLQNIPARGEDGRRIRAGIVAKPGFVLMSADYSQIELRILAHLANDPHFLDAFARGEDIHARTAKEIITGGRPVDKEARRRAKAINFGIIYGQTDFGLSRGLGIPRAEAQAYIQQYFARYSRIRGYFDQTIERGRQTGYVETLFHRRRPVPNLVHRNGSLRQAAERIAMNAPIQGSAADLIKIAMLAVYRELGRMGAESTLLLQVHDELVLEVAEGERQAVEQLVRREMTQAAALRVPLQVEVGAAHNWADAH